MNETQPKVVVLAGPNGAGKTTAAPYLLRDTLGIDAFVNADTIAAEISADNSATEAYRAAAIMRERMRELMARRESFAFETTLASRSVLAWVRDLSDGGFVTDLRYLWLPNPELAVERVKARVAMGGHDVASSVVCRRFHRSIKNLKQLYVHAFDIWSVCDSSGLMPQLIATGGRGRAVDIRDAEVWSTIMR